MKFFHSFYIIALLTLLILGCKKNSNNPTPKGTISSNPISQPTPTVTYFAGGFQGTLDGIGRNAQFVNPSSLTTDDSGNVYVIDYGNRNIRKITPAAVVTTLAKNAGSFGIAIDHSGYLYTTFNNSICKISPSGIITTIAGSDSAGLLNATGSNALFNRPWGLTVDAGGNIYVADEGNNLVRKINQQGIVSTLAGDTVPGYANGLDNAASFNQPEGITVDSAGNIYVTDSFNGILRKITPSGLVTTIAGNYVLINGVASTNNCVYNGVAIDLSGNIYVINRYQFQVTKISPKGMVNILMLANYYSGGSGILSGALDGISVTKTGIVYVSDSYNNAIIKIENF